jgi:hypothetical protein
MTKRYCSITDRRPKSLLPWEARDHALDDFLLQHEMHVAHAAAKTSKMEKQRRRDVVRQIADNAQAGVLRRLPARLTEIEEQASPAWMVNFLW